jgi:hypothetical protein
MGLPAQNQSLGVINYEALERERALKLQVELQNRLKTEVQGRQEGLRMVVLRWVVATDYDKAADGIDHYVASKHQYPDFAPRVEPMVQHAKELINAIRSKRNLPGLSQLSMTKQKEILDHVVSHFNELKTTLKSMEKVANDVALSDVRSTVWFIKSLSYTVLGLVIFYLVLNFNKEIGQPFWIVFNEMNNFLFNKLAALFGS